MTDVDAFAALANPVRRAILARLRDGPLPASEIARAFDIGRPAVSEHLQVLRRAHLVRDETRGRERHYYLDARPLAEVEAWVATFTRYWNERLDGLGQLLSRQEPP
ncbi:MAG: winged helix-turn-helix transcriptional regulator [Deltaproteobacteria bacterium]|nr:winged helix-turn-helix transcriptional regulator [Deltaproteobacteria bacterium]